MALSPSNEPLVLQVSSENRVNDVRYAILGAIDHAVKLSIITPSGELALDDTEKTIGEISTPAVPLLRYSLLKYAGPEDYC